MNIEPEMSSLLDGIKEAIDSFNKAIEAQLPALTNEINELIQSKCKDESKIENTLDTMLSLTMHGRCDNLFIKLLDYYKTVSTDGAAFYWNEYDKQNEE